MGEMPHVRPRSVLLALLALLVLAAPASASRTQTTSFEAPKDLLNPDTRPASARRDPGPGGLEPARRHVLALRRAVRGVLPEARRRHSRTRPPTPGAQYDALLDDAKARGMDVLLTVSGPVPRWATEDKQDNFTRPVPAEFAQLHDGGRPAHGLARRRRGRSGTSRTSPSSCARSSTRSTGPSRRGSTAALYKAALKGLGAAKVASPKVLLGETSPRGTGKVVAPLTFLRGALCLDSKDRLQKGCGKLATAGYRPPRLHDARRARGSGRPARTT